VRNTLAGPLFAAGLLFLLGCASAPQQPQDRGRERIIERQRMVWVIGEEYPFIWDPEVVAFVSRIGNSLAQAMGVSQNTFHYYVIDQPTVNAFTTPLGDIFVFSGMLMGMRNSSELAGVLAHEMAHVRADHFTEMQRRATLGSIPGFVAAILSRGDPRVIATTIAAAQSYQLHWSREMEIESDRLALQYLRSTRYDPAGLLGALEVIEKGERLVPAGSVPEGLLTHPVISFRIASMEGSLGMEPGRRYLPAPDREWERMSAVLLALSEKSSVARAKYRQGPSNSGKETDLALAGLVLSRLGDYPAAEERLRRALSEDPRSHLLLSDLGAALFHQGKIDEARGLLLRSLQEAGGEEYSYPHYYLGEISRQEGDGEAAFREMQRAVAAWPPISEAHYQLALMLAEKGRLGEADYHFGRAARLRGDFASALRSFTRAEARLGSDPSWSARISEELWRMQ